MLYTFLDKPGERTYINKMLYILLLRISKNTFLLRDKKERKDIWIKWSVLQRNIVNLLFSKEIYRVNRKSIFKFYLMKVMIYIYILPYLNMIDIKEEDINYNYYHRIQEHEVK